MKKHLAVFEYFLHEMIYKLLFGLLIMATIECSVFCINMKNYADHSLPAFSVIFDNSEISRYFFVFTLICFFICILPLRNRENIKLRLACLSTSKMSLLLSKAAANLLIFSIFWLGQCVILAALGLFYSIQPNNVAGPQGLLLSFYSEPFLTLFSAKFTYLPLSWYFFSLLAIAMITALINLIYIEHGQLPVFLATFLLLPIFFVVVSLSRVHAYICIAYEIIICGVALFFRLHPLKKKKRQAITENIDFIEKLKNVQQEDLK